MITLVLGVFASLSALITYARLPGSADAQDAEARDTTRPRQGHITVK